MDIPEDEWLLISGLQHFIFCPRQYALIHLDQYWRDNYFTSSGELQHQRVDLPGRRGDRKRRVEYALPLSSRRLGITGRADAVEFLEAAVPPAIYPVEYKHGDVKTDRCDEVQLCAQALCLEEMLGITIPQAFLFYFETRDRIPVELTADLREFTETTIAQCHRLIAVGLIPPGEYVAGKCSACSLLEYCLPRRPNAPDRRQQLEDALA